MGVGCVEALHQIFSSAIRFSLDVILAFDFNGDEFYVYFSWYIIIAYFQQEMFFWEGPSVILIGPRWIVMSREHEYHQVKDQEVWAVGLAMRS